MPDYREMYLTLFRKVAAVIEELQDIQRMTEEMYISDSLPDDGSLDEIEQDRENA